jgi:hypothetical protein
MESSLVGLGTNKRFPPVGTFDFRGGDDRRLLCVGGVKPQMDDVALCISHEKRVARS